MTTATRPTRTQVTNKAMMKAGLLDNIRRVTWTRLVRSPQERISPHQILIISQDQLRKKGSSYKKQEVGS